MTRTGRSRRCVLAASLLAAGCVTVIEDVPNGDSGELALPEIAVTQTIPLGTAGGSPEERVLIQLYGGILQRMQEAVEERPPDTAALFALLNAYQKPNLPDWLAERLAGYRGLAHGLAFLEHAVENASLRLVAAAAAPLPVAKPGDPVAVPAIGAPVRFEFTLPAPAPAVRLGGDDRNGLSIVMKIEDDFVTGASKQMTKTALHWIEDEFELAGDQALRLPLQFEIPADDAVRRSIHLRVDLIGGYVRTAGMRAPVQRRTLAATALTQWPAGHEPILKRPLATLREAIRLGDEKHFAHVYLGASFATGADREAAIGLLIDQVRLGNAAQATVAMATLRAVTNADIAVGDRERWLAWFDLRR